MIQHTPGPWVYFGDDNSPFWGQIRGTQDFSLIAQQVDGDDRHEDFVLMAAAPELYAACVNLVRWMAEEMNVKNTNEIAIIAERIKILGYAKEIAIIIERIEQESAQ